MPENKGIESRTTGLMSAASFVSEIGRYSSGRNLPLNCTHSVSQSVKFPSVSTPRSLFLDDLSIVSWRPAGIHDAVDETLSQSNSVYWLKITFKTLTLLSEEKTNEQKISLAKIRECVRDYAREKCIKDPNLIFCFFFNYVKLFAATLEFSAYRVLQRIFPVIKNGNISRVD